MPIVYGFISIEDTKRFTLFLAGKATGTIYNGTMFKRDGLEINKAYLCDNYVDEEYSNNVQVRIISLVSTTELVELSTQLGKASTVVAKATE